MSALKEQIAQAMRDNNGAEYWEPSAHMMPVGHFASVACAAVAKWLRSVEAAKVVRLASSDPGAFTTRRHDKDADSGYEPLWIWQARAMQLALADLIAGGE